MAKPITIATIDAGIELCRDGDWQRGLQMLWKAAEGAGEGSELPPAFYSFTGYGVARFQRRLAEGERLCRHAVRLDPADPEHRLLLARVCLLRRNRKAAVKALLAGLRIAPNDSRLRRLEQKMVLRRPPVISFLSRDNILNRLLGWLRHYRRSSK